MNEEGSYKWFSGDDVIDWYGIHVLHVNDFAEAGWKAENTATFLTMAHEHRKPWWSPGPPHGTPTLQ